MEPDRSAPSGPPVAAVRSTGSDRRRPVSPRGHAVDGVQGLEGHPALSSWRSGDRVNHDKYGLGTVVATDGGGPRATATIDFGSAGTVRLMLIGGVPMVKL